jgi:hypothetical protein
MAALAFSPSNQRQRLAELFQRNGYKRAQSTDRLAEGWRAYKKGQEVRFILFTRSELREVRRLLKQAGFEPGIPYRKNPTQWCQPVYGKRQSAQLLALLLDRATPDGPATEGKL